MATAYVTIGPVGAKSKNGVTQCFLGSGVQSETVTTSGTSAQGSLAATGGDIAQIFCDTAVYALAGANPTASATAGIYVPGGQAAYLILNPGDKIALIDV